MTALIIDSSQKISLLGTAEGGILTSSKTLEGLSSSLPSALKDFCELNKLEVIAVGVGPGSYMGIRTAATIAKTLSFALGIPLIEFPSPLAFLPPGGKDWTIVGDAKMGEIYSMTGNIEEGLSVPKLVSLEKFTLPMDRVLDLRKELTPYLDGVAKYVHKQFIKGNTIELNGLQLQYLR